MLDAVPWLDVTPKEKYELCRWQRSIRVINLIQKRLARPNRAVGITKVICNLIRHGASPCSVQCQFQLLVRPAKHLWVGRVCHFIRFILCLFLGRPNWDSAPYSLTSGILLVRARRTLQCLTPATLSLVILKLRSAWANGIEPVFRSA